MPAPKRVLVEKPSGRRSAPKGVFASTYDTLTSSENAAVVRSIALFGVSLHAHLVPCMETLLTSFAGCCYIPLQPLGRAASASVCDTPLNLDLR